MNTLTRTGSLVAAGVLALTLAGCGGAEAPPVPPVAATAPSSQAAPGAAAPSGTGTVSANSASEEEIVAALQGAGVDNAGQWAGEVVEYRPYADASFTDLREELAKYNADPATIDTIVSVLIP